MKNTACLANYHSSPDISKAVFEEFLTALEKNGVDAQIVARLRTQLLIKKVVTENALGEALFPLLDQL